MKPSTHPADSCATPTTRPRRPWLAWALALGLLTALTPAQAARLALVVGNDSYQYVSRLSNAGNDAELMERTLRAAGFEVVPLKNLSRKAFYQAINTLKKRLNKGDEVVFFFAGHGVQVGSDAVLLPVDIQAGSEEELRQEGVPLLEVQDALKEARFSLLVIDACRDNPFPKAGTRTVGESRGLKLPEVAKGQAIILSAGRNQKALDSVPGQGNAKNGLFTYEFARILTTPGLDVRSALQQVRDRVEDQAAKVNHEQRPSLMDEMRGNFYFVPAGSGNRTRPADEVVADVGVVPAEAPPVPRPVGGVNLADLKKAEQARQAWAQWQARMQADYNEAAAFIGSPDLRVQAWERFLEAWKEDNPNSAEDEGLRTQATGKLGQARAEVAQQAQRQQAAARQQSQPVGETLDGRWQILAGGAEVKDLETGLVWQRCSVGQRWSGSGCTGEAKEFNWDAAQALSGNGWRVPTVRELASLRVCSKGFSSEKKDLQDGKAQIPYYCAGDNDRPTIHKGAFPQTPVTVFWSSSPVVDYGAWDVDFGNGSVGGSYRRSAFAVRLVRASQ